MRFAFPLRVDGKIEWLVRVASALGMNPIRVRWKLMALGRWWEGLKRDVAPATSRRFRHQKCWSCGQIRPIDETRCGHCEVRLGSKSAAFMRSLGFVVPPSLAVSSLLVSLNVAIYVRVWMVDGARSLSLSHEALHAFGAHGSYGFLDPSDAWRVLAAMFLHFNVLHLGMNMLSLLQVGPSVEDLLGRGEMLLAFLVTGIAGNLLSELRPTPFIGAGASGAVLGLVGLAAGIGHASHSIEGRAIRNRMLQWGGYTLLFGIAIGADHLAHVGGFLTGGVWGLLRAKRVVFRGQPPSHPVLGLIGGILLAGSVLPPLLRRVDPRELTRPSVYQRRDDDPAEREIAPPVSAYPAKESVPQPKSVSIEALFPELERAGTPDPRGAYVA
jgi:membrane associated rhomboid family serine protease